MNLTTLAAILAATAFGLPALAASGDGAPRREVFFAFDSARLDDGAAIARLARDANAAPGTWVVLDAHCDPVGTAPYNVQLAIRRAESVRDALVAAGVDESRIVLSVYGEDGAPRETHAEDRRVGMTLTRESIASLVDATFAGHGTAVTWERPLTTAQIDGPTVPAVATR